MTRILTNSMTEAVMARKVHRYLLMRMFTSLVEIIANSNESLPVNIVTV